MENIDEMPIEYVWRYDDASDISYAMRFDEGYGLVMEVTGNSLEKVVESTINASIDGNREVWLT